MEKLKVVEKAPTFFCCDGYMYSKNEYKNKIYLQCVLYKKDCSGTAYIEFGKLFNNQKLNHSKSFAEIEKTKIETSIKNESETSSSLRGIIITKTSTPKTLT